MSKENQSSESSPPSEKASERDESPAEETHEEPASSPWWSFGLVSAAAAAAAAAVTGSDRASAGSPADEASGDEQEDSGAADRRGAATGDAAAKDGETGATVRFHPEATAGGRGAGRRRKVREDAVANMGFVELVENLLLTHDSSSRRNYRSSSVGSIVTEASEPDSEVDSTEPQREEEGLDQESWEWEAEEISAFASQIHMKMRQQLEQEAAFVELGFKSGIAVMAGALGIEDDTKMLLREGRLAGLGLTPLDDETQTNIQRIDLSMLLTLTPQNYEQWKKSLCLVPPQPVLSVRSSHRHSNRSRLVSPTGISDQLRSPLFKMHRELARLGSTSSEDSVSDYDTEQNSSAANSSSSSKHVDLPLTANATNPSGGTKTSSQRTLGVPGGVKPEVPPLPTGVPRLHLGPTLSVTVPSGDCPSPSSGVSSSLPPAGGSSLQVGGPS